MSRFSLPYSVIDLTTYKRPVITEARKNHTVGGRPAALVAVHVVVRELQQLVEALFAARSDCISQTDSDHVPLLPHRDPTSEGRSQFAHRPLNACVRGRRKQDAEFVPTQTRNGVGAS